VRVRRRRRGGCGAAAKAGCVVVFAGGGFIVILKLPIRKASRGRKILTGRWCLSGRTICVSAGINSGRFRSGQRQEFWFYVSRGWIRRRWGEKKDVPACTEELGFNPCYLAEALGQIDLNRDWTLMQQPGFDILVAPDVGASRRCYINCCTYRWNG